MHSGSAGGGETDLFCDKSQIKYQPYLGGALQDSSLISPDTRHVIDSEVQGIVTQQYERAQALLRTHRTALERLTEQLLQQETVDGSAVKEALENDAHAPVQNSQARNGLFIDAVIH